MDLLQETYAKSSDEEDEENVARSIICAKRRRSEGHSFHGLRSPPMSSHSCLSVGEPDQAPQVAGRYISKRERRMLLTSSTKPLDFRPSVIMSSDDGSLSDTDIPVDIKLQLKGQCKTYAHGNNISGNLVHTLMGHSKAINSIQWSHNYGVYRSLHLPMHQISSLKYMLCGAIKWELHRNLLCKASLQVGCI